MSDYLPHEVVRDILLRLPVKPLIRFRCVSKSWNSLITSSDFIDSHLTRSHSLPSNSNSNNTLLIVRDLATKPNVEKYRLIRNDSFDRPEHLEFPLTIGSRSRIYKCVFIGYANGLFCLYERERFVLCNPSIRKCIILPKHCSKIKTDARVQFHSAFGFDPRTNDYKVVIIELLYDMKKDPTLVEVYSLSEGSWKMIDASSSFPPNVRFNESKCPAVSLNGAIHFTVRDILNFPKSAVLSFDLRDEVFHVISLPDSISTLGYIYASVFRGLLSLICRRDTPNKCSVWVMKEYGVVDSWTKQFTFDHRGQYVTGLRKNGHVLMKNVAIITGDMLHLFEKGKMELDLLPSYMLSSYDPVSQQFKNLGSIGKALQCVDNYIENLVLLRKPNDAVSSKGVSGKRKCRSLSPQSDQISAVGLQGEVKKALPLPGGIGRVELEDERVRDKETIHELKKAMTHQQEEIATLKIEMATLKSEMAILKSQALSVQQSSNQVENTSGSVGDVGS